MHLPGDHSLARRKIATWQMHKPAHLLMLVAATSSEGEDFSVCEAFLPRDISQRGAVLGMVWAVGARGVGGSGWLAKISGRTPPDRQFRGEGPTRLGESPVRRGDVFQGTGLIRVRIRRGARRLPISQRREFRLLRGVRRLGSVQGAGIPGLRNAHVASAPRVWQWLGPHPYRACVVSGRVRRSLPTSLRGSSASCSGLRQGTLLRPVTASCPSGRFSSRL